MRGIILLVLASLLVFGCTGPSTQGGTGGLIPNVTVPATGGAQAQACSPSYSFSDLSPSVLSDTVPLVATVGCAAGETLTVSIDGQNVNSATITTNDTQPVKLDFPAIKDGTVNVTVDYSGVTLYSRQLVVSPLGDSETGSSDYDAVSFSQWEAQAVDVQNQITPSMVKIFAKRQDYQTTPGENIMVEIRKDNGGNPGDVIASSEMPINATALNYLWLKFPFNNAPTLGPGKYWVDFLVEQTNVAVVSDVMNWHYTTVDKSSPGNSYTRQMMLSVDAHSGKASVTQWQPLPYDKVYTMVLTTGSR